jgi:uncharacterized OsmC-like protein
VRVRAGRETVQVDELDLFGGTGLAPNPNQYALAALGACEATLRVEEHCAILDVFANSVPVETVLEVA